MQSEVDWLETDQAITILDRRDQAQSWLESNQIRDADRGWANLRSIARSGMTLDQFVWFCHQFRQTVSELSDPDMALNNIERWLAAARSPLACGALFQRDPTALPILLRIFSASQYLSDLLIRDTESYDSLRLTEGQLYSRSILVDELVNSITAAKESTQAMQILRRFKRRETLRIAFGDLIVGHRMDQVVQQISLLAESIIEAGLCFARRQLNERRGQPTTARGQLGRFTILALGKLGGNELNYSSDIDLIAVYESTGTSSPSGHSSQAYFERMTRDLIRLLSESTALGAAYRVDMRLRPHGSRGPICCSAPSFFQYYDLQGRTWERQALIKARPVAGDLDFGNELLKQLSSWIYRPITNRFDIQGIKALKRQIEHRVILAGEDRTNIKTGRGGIRDIEFTIQFLQLLHGGWDQSVRTGNTLEAIHNMSATNCLSRQEASLLTQNYCWLRKMEHLLQIMFDLQIHSLPTNPQELSKLAIRMGYREYFGVAVLDQFQRDLNEITDINRQILNHVLHNAFSTSESDENSTLLNGIDLVLQPEMSGEEVCRILAPYRFGDPIQARRLIDSLARETTIFLSSRRCRHFLASVIEPLLQRMAETPNPDTTLASLSSVADAIGGKGALWELFSFNPPSLELFIRLCASSDYLCSIIRRNPGMIDELIDSLLMKQLPTRQWLRDHLEDLTNEAMDIHPILHSFKAVQHLRVGIRDIVGLDPVRQTHRFLSDVAEVCLEKIAEVEFRRCAAKYSNSAADDGRNAKRNQMVILAMGKLGGQEPNYHSDLDVVFVYDCSQSSQAWLNTSPQHFYSELATRITKAITETGPNGKLYELDCRLRPTGRSGALAVSLSEFQRYFYSGSGQLWERQALCKSRPIAGQPWLQQKIRQVTMNILSIVPWDAEMADQIRDMRLRLQDNCNRQNLKRGIGGTMDVEFAVQMLQLKLARQYPAVLVPGTIEALEVLVKVQALDGNIGAYLLESYQVLRGVESRLRLMNTTARHDFPEGPELDKLAYLLHIKPHELMAQVNEHRRQTRQYVETVFQSASRQS